MMPIHHELLVMMRLHQQQYGHGNAEAMVASMHDHMSRHFNAAYASQATAQAAYHAKNIAMVADAHAAEIAALTAEIEALNAAVPVVEPAPAPAEAGAL